MAKKKSYKTRYVSWLVPTTSPPALAFGVQVAAWRRHFIGCVVRGGRTNVDGRGDVIVVTRTEPSAGGVRHRRGADVRLATETFLKRLSGVYRCYVMTNDNDMRLEKTEREREKVVPKQTRL
jgi:hypothetical protein